METTLILIKPDAMQRTLAGTIISRFENRGLKIIAAKLLLVSKELAEEHYGEHAGKPFFTNLVEYITSSPIMALVLAGNDAVKVTRQTIGSTDPKEASPGTIRGDYGIDLGRNLVHGSDSPESAKREINIFFAEDDINEWIMTNEKWILE
ncbi:MAG: nucleoside-diphosphate kinase [Dehalococcoidia bacterium]|jgi:nucleoside-diphosphate kinase|nr:MAG: nucleoside-diphosphate kinase [Chloroflexota bacterium]|tara:strand:+ start:4648 stop:5097 length:450 start_codon:yes stop_codon:yes gene_type:complete